LEGIIIDFGAIFKQTLVLQMINVAILFIVLKHFLFKPVTEFMEKRKQGILDDIKKARDKERNAEVLEKTYRKKIEEIEDKETVILSNARKEAIEMKDKIVSEARDEASKIVDRAKKEVETYKVSAKENIKTEMIEVAGVISKKVIDIEVDTNKHNEIIEDGIKDLGELEWIG